MRHSRFLALGVLLASLGMLPAQSSRERHRQRSRERARQAFHDALKRWTAASHAAPLGLRTRMIHHASEGERMEIRRETLKETIPAAQALARASRQLGRIVDAMGPATLVRAAPDARLLLEQVRGWAHAIRGHPYLFVIDSKNRAEVPVPGTARRLAQLPSRAARLDQLCQGIVRELLRRRDELAKPTVEKARLPVEQKTPRLDKRLKAIEKLARSLDRSLARLVRP